MAGLGLQAHVHADCRAVWPGSEFDQIAELVDEPQAMTGRPVGGPPAAGQRISDVPRILHLADNLAGAGPDPQHAAAGGMAQGVRGDLAGGEHQVGGPVCGQSGLPGTLYYPLPHRPQVTLVEHRPDTRWRGQGAVIRRRDLSLSGIAWAGADLAVTDHGRMRLLGARGHMRTQLPGVAQAQYRATSLGGGQADERFVPHG